MPSQPACQALAAAHGGDLNANRAVKVFQRPPAFERIHEWVENEQRTVPHFRMWPDIATSVPHNFRNSVPFDRL